MLGQPQLGVPVTKGERSCSQRSARRAPVAVTPSGWKATIQIPGHLCGRQMRCRPSPVTWGIGSIQHKSKGTRRATGSANSTAGVVELRGPSSGCSSTSLNPRHLLLRRILPWERCLARLSKVELLCSCSPMALLLLLLYNFHVKLAASLICLKHWQGWLDLYETTPAEDWGMLVISIKIYLNCLAYT